MWKKKKFFIRASLRLWPLYVLTLPKKVRKWLDFETYRFLQIVRYNSSLNDLNKMSNLEILKQLLLEKSWFVTTFNLIKKNLFFRWVRLYHNKIDFLWQMWSLLFFNNKYFPQITSRWFLKKLFWFKWKRFLRSKLHKINYHFMKTLIYNFKKNVNWKEVYYLAWDAYFSQVAVLSPNVYQFWKKMLGLGKFWWVMRRRIVKRIINKFARWFTGKKSKLSFVLSKQLTRTLGYPAMKNWILKFRWKFISVPVKTDSFYKIFKYEFQVPFQSLFFWKSILRFTNTKYFLLPAKKLLITDINPLLNLLTARLNSLGDKHENFIGFAKRIKTFVLHGYDFFNTSWLEKTILPIVQYFLMFKKSFLLPIAINYLDILFLKWKFLPPKVVKLLDLLILQLFRVKNFSIFESEDSDYDKLLTLFFYKFVNEVFELVFNFSPGNIVFFKSKKWKFLFNSRHLHLSFIGWNWDYLKYYSREYSYIYRKRWNKLPFEWTNVFSFKRYFYDFYFFVWRTKYWKIWKTLKYIAKKRWVFDLTKYISKVFFPNNFIWAQMFWWFFFMWPELKTVWFRNQINYGRVKAIYDTYMYFQNWFWVKFYLRKTSFERLLLYGFVFWAGVLDFNLDWNFFVGYKGTLGFKLKRRKNIKMGWKRLMSERVSLGFLGEMRHNSLFFSFFTFLNWAIMLKYYLQFGHTKANYNTTYKDYLVMIYNDWFILNMLNIQLNLKWNLRVMFKMFYLAGFVCLVAPFNILLEGLIGVYGAYGDQPYTRYIWINGLYSNFDKIFLAIQWTVADSYSGRVFFSRKITRKLIWLWFSMWGLIQNLNVDISFFPSLYWSSWVFLESCAWFYPTITTSNTECFLPTAYLEYTTVCNDFSLLSLCLYLNLILVMFKWSKLTRQVEFSVYPQKLISQALQHKILPLKINFKHYHLQWQMRVVMAFVWKSWAAIFDFSKADLTYVYKYFFIFWRLALNITWKQLFWWFLYFWPRKSMSAKFF